MKTLIYVLRLWFDFNVLLPAWYVIMQIGDMLGASKGSD